MEDGKNLWLAISHMDVWTSSTASSTCNEHFGSASYTAKVGCIDASSGGSRAPRNGTEEVDSLWAARTPLPELQTVLASRRSQHTVCWDM